MAHISVIITAYNYAPYLPQCLDSVLGQRYRDFEIIAVNDGSTDDTAAILERYRGAHPERIQVLTRANGGLAKAANAGIRASHGEYVIRLDADDYFDENILLVEANILDTEPSIDMVYSDYYRIDTQGEVIDTYRLPKVHEEVKLLDRNPLAAGALYRRRCFDALGGYDETLKYQEDYDFWTRFTAQFKAYNVNVPLMYYRRHEASMSNNFEGRMKARQYVKKKCLAAKHLPPVRVWAFIPAMGTFRSIGNLAARLVGGQPLIAYTIAAAKQCALIERVMVSTEDQTIAALAANAGAEIPFLRPAELARTTVAAEDVLRHMLEWFSARGVVLPDYIAVLPYITPFRTERHITEAIDTIRLYECDSVIGVTTDLTFHWKPGEYGLMPVGYQKRILRQDKETIYKEACAVYVVTTDEVRRGGYLGTTIGHIELSPIDAWRIESEFECAVAERIMQGDIAGVANAGERGRV